MCFLPHFGLFSPRLKSRVVFSHNIPIAGEYIKLSQVGRWPVLAVHLPGGVLLRLQRRTANPSTAALLLRFHANILIVAEYLKVWSDELGGPPSGLKEGV